MRQTRPGTRPAGTAGHPAPRARHPGRAAAYRGAGTITREGDHYRIDGWVFEGKDGQARQVQPGEDAKRSDGLETQQLINQAALAREQERAEARHEAGRDMEPEAT